MRGPAFFAYSDNYLIDVKVGIIMDVEASRSVRQAEVGASQTMLERTQERFAIQPERLAGDTGLASDRKLLAADQSGRNTRFNDTLKDPAENVVVTEPLIIRASSVKDLSQQ